MRTHVRVAALASAALAASLLTAGAQAAAGPADRCRGERLIVPGAAHRLAACLPDLTTAGTIPSGHTDPADWAGLEAPGTVKGSTGPLIFQDGDRPGDAIAEWHSRFAQLTRAAQRVAAQHYGRPPATTYAAGQSIAGYLVRWQLEHNPHLYTGGVDWNGVLLAEREPNLLASLPPALRAYPRYVAGEAGAHEAMLAAGYPAGSEPLWRWHYDNQWDVLQRIIREEVDPGYDGATQAGTPFCPEGTGAGCDTDYDYASRPREVHRTVERVALTGRIGRPLVTIHGTLDVLIPISASSDRYAAMVRRSGRAGLHRYHRVAGGTHTDGLVALAPALVRPMQPCFRAAFDSLERWTRHGTGPRPLNGC